MKTKRNVKVKSNKAVIYARAASGSKDGRPSVQEQLKSCRRYAQSKGLDVVREFAGAGTGANSSVASQVTSVPERARPMFQEMICFLKEHPDCRHLIAQKIDRLTRSIVGFVALKELPVDLHLAENGRIVGPVDSPVDAMTIFLKQNFSANLRQAITKGLSERAGRGLYPGRAPLGYRNSRTNRSIEVDSKAARSVRRIFSLYATGKYTLEQLPRAVEKRTGLRISRDRLVQILSSPFYAGWFTWKGQMYKGNHQLVIPGHTYRKVGRLLAATQKPPLGGKIPGRRVRRQLIGVQS